MLSLTFSLRLHMTDNWASEPTQGNYSALFFLWWVVSTRGEDGSLLFPLSGVPPEAPPSTPSTHFRRPLYIPCHCCDTLVSTFFCSSHTRVGGGYLVTWRMMVYPTLLFDSDEETRQSLKTTISDGPLSSLKAKPLSFEGRRGRLAPLFRSLSPHTSN